MTGQRIGTMLLLALLCVAGFLSARVSDNSLELEFKKEFPFLEMNNSMKVSSETNTFHFGDTIRLRIENISGQKILMDSSENIQLMLAIGNEWRIIQNDINYIFIEGGLVLFPLGDIGLRDNTGLTIVPAWDEALGEPPSEGLLRVVIPGRFVNEESSRADQVGAYTDLALIPVSGH